MEAVKKEKAVLAGLSASSMPEEERSTEISMEELAALVETAGAETVGYLLQSRPTPEARCFIRDGRRPPWRSRQSKGPGPDISRFLSSSEAHIQ